MYKNKVLLYVALFFALKMKKKHAKYWIHPLNLERKINGEFYRISLKLEEYPVRYFRYFRMSKEQFDVILCKIHHRIRPTPNNFRKHTISPKEKLVLTLR